MWFLKEVWDAVTFADFRRSLDWMDFVMSVMMLICVGVLVFIVVFLVWWIDYTVYRLIAYDYTTEIYSATVTKKEYEPEETVYMYNPALKNPHPDYARCGVQCLFRDAEWVEGCD